MESSIKPKSGSTSNIETKSKSTVDSKKDGPPLAKTNIFQKFRRNWPQIMKILPGILFMWTAGMKLFWQTHIPYIKISSTQYMILIAWFISVTVGALLAVLFINKKLKVNTVYITAAILHLTSLVGFTQISKNQSYDNIVILYVDVILPGFIFGLNFVTVLCYAVDNSTREFRGKLIRLICKSSWIFTVLLKLLLPSDPEAVAIFKQIIYISIAVLVFITIYYISKNTFDQLLQSLIREDEDKEAMELVESQPSVDKETGWTGCNICTKDIIRPFILVLGSRILAVLVNNIPLLFIILWLTDESLTEILHTKSDATFACYLALSTKVVAGIGVILVPDCIGDCIENRKIKIIRSHRIYYIASIVFAVSLVISYYIMYVPFNVLVILIYAVIGVGIDAISFKYLSEAFPLKRRSGLIAIVLIIETFFDSGLTASFSFSFSNKNKNKTLQLIMAVGIAIISISLLICLPTKRDKQRLAK